MYTFAHLQSNQKIRNTHTYTHTHTHTYTYTYLHVYFYITHTHTCKLWHTTRKKQIPTPPLLSVTSQQQLFKRRA